MSFWKIAPFNIWLTEQDIKYYYMFINSLVYQVRSLEEIAGNVNNKANQQTLCILHNLNFVLQNLYFLVLKIDINWKHNTTNICGKNQTILECKLAIT